MGYIVDKYNRFDQFDRKHTIRIFQIGERQYGIKWVIVGTDGEIKLPQRIEREWQQWEYQVYERYEDAQEYVNFILNLRR